MTFIEPGQFEASQKLLGGRFEVRGDDAKNFDELISPGGHIHFEMIDKGELFIGLEPRQGGGYSTKRIRRVAIWIRAKRGKLEVVVGEDE